MGGGQMSRNSLFYFLNALHYLMVPKPYYLKLFLSTLFHKYGILIGLIPTEALHFVQSDKRGHSEE